MGPTDILRAEHHVILRSLDVLEHLAESEPFHGEGASLLVDFLRTYADTYHHLKEEHHLFPALVTCGMPSHAGPIAVMLDDHVEGRALVKAMGAALEAGDPDAFRVPAREFVALLRDHIAKENGVLFHMADQMIPADAVPALLAGYEEAEADCGPRAEELRRQVLDLAEELDIPEAGAHAPGCMGSS